MILTIIAFVVILGILVLVHEIGHFVAAKRSGVRVFEFGIGFPPRICGLQRVVKIDENGNQKKSWKVVWGKHKMSDEEDPNANKNTVYSINWFPIGGFVRLKGESGEEADASDSLASKPGWRRALVLSAGVLMNYILCIVLIAIGYMIGLPQALEGLPDDAQVRDKKIQVVSVLDNSPAQSAELQIGDAVISLDGKELASINEIQGYVDQKIDTSVGLVVKRGQEEINKEIRPTRLEETGRGGLGVGLIETGVISYPVHTAIWKGTETTLVLTKAIVVAFAGLIKDLLVVRQVTVDVAGPVGIAVMTGQVARMGFIYLLQFTALLSVHLAIINILPIPALDGGHLLFLLIEKIRRRPLSQKIEAALNNGFFLLLMLLILVVTVRDVAKFSDKFVGLWENIKNIF